jgi:heme-degrading monooxygenase HmoA
MEQPRQFLSFGTWADLESVRAWRATSEFARLLGRCRELCEEFHAADYSLAASPTRAPATSRQGTATHGV